MKTSYVILLCVFLAILGVNAKNTHVFSERAKASFKEVATPESTVRWMTVKETEKVSKDLFLQKSKVIFDLDEKTTFKEIRTNEECQLSDDNQGWKHYRLQQMYKGIPIEGAHYLLHEKNGLIETANGDVVAGLKINTMPSISEEAALQILLDEIGANKYAWESENQENLIKNQLKDQNATNFPKGKLVIATTSEKLVAEDLTLGYKFKVKTIDPITHAEYIVDAYTGNLIHKNSLLCQYDVQGTCLTHRYGQQSITTHYDNNDYRLTQSGRNIEIYNGNGDDSDELGIIYFNHPTNYWNTLDHKFGCEAYWVLEKTYDYFHDTLNWKGHDNNGSKLMTWVNVGENWSNAKGGGGEIYLGEGDGIDQGPFTAIDIVAHEFAHSVIQSCGANLQYSRESGALNESFADIFGTVVEFYAEPNANNKDWLLGEDISLIGNAGAIRDMSNPATKGHPATYEDDNWGAVTSNCNVLNDYCHVHKNSGVQNHWFYILSNGKSGTNYYGYNYNISGIGMDKAAQLAFENLKNYLAPYSSYMDARNGSIQAANTLNFNAIEINQVKEAWCAVGLGNCDINTTGVITVTSPNGGESLNQGNAKNITWTTSGSTGAEVKIEYSINAGNEWHSITKATSNDGTYEWFLPYITTNLALIRVSSLSNETIIDSSDDYFSINNNTCAVNANFDISNDKPCVNETVVFTSSSTGGADINEWYINGAFIYDGAIFNHAFTQSGHQEVELRSSIEGVCGDVKVYSVFVQPTANANFTYNTVSEITSLSAPDNAFDATYLWTTGDGRNFDRPNIGKIYDNAGIYTVCLEVTSSCGYDNHCENVQANVLGCIDANACNYFSNANIDNGSCIYENCNDCLVNDSLTLVALYNATDGPNWFNTWDLSQPVNTWYGVASTAGCHIYKIELNSNNLVGTIPPEIGNFQNLEWLYLYDNSLSGTIPLEIGNLEKLHTIHLGENNLSGTIPVELGNLQNLIEISLYKNNLSGEIPKEIGNLQGLYKIVLYDNNLTGSIPVEISNLQNLIRLSISINNLSGVIPSEIGNLQNLEFLSLSENNLSGSIPVEIGNLQSLEHISLRDNNLSGSIPSEMGDLQNLTKLYLYNNDLSGCYPPSLCDLTLNDFGFYGNAGLPNSGSDQSFLDFCNGNAPCISTSETEVYPGDLNFDGVADYKDILSFGLYNGEFGLSREEAYQDINWYGHPSSDWGASQENNADIKHIDADGNGVIDLNDLEAIQVNYENTHNASLDTSSTNYNNNSPIEITLQENSIPSFVGNNDQLILDIKIEDVQGSELALYGGYFSIDYYDPDWVINDIEVVLDESWLGTPNHNLEYIIHNDDINKKISVGFTKIDHQNSIGEGTIGRVIAAINNDTPWDTITLNFNVSNILMQDVQAFALPAGTSATETTFTIPQPSCEPSINITSSTSLSNHVAQGLIQTIGNVLVIDNQDITFGSDQLKINDGLTIEAGGEFVFYNDPCETVNRNAGSGEGYIKSNKLFKSGNYRVIEDQLVFNLDLIKEGKVSFEILNNLKNKTISENISQYEFGNKTKGTQQISIPLESLHTDKFYACFKVGADRYYFEVSL